MKLTPKSLNPAKTLRSAEHSPLQRFSFQRFSFSLTPPAPVSSDSRKKQFPSGSWTALALCFAFLPACDSKDPSGKKPEPIAAETPGYFFFEAEACDPVGETVEAGDASGSAFVRKQSGGYEPVLRCDVPASEKPLAIWLRHKGGAAQTKVSAGGEQKAGPWVYGSEEQFVWNSFGEIQPGEEGRVLTVIGSGKDDQTVSIDCVLFSTEPPADLDSLLTPLPTVRIDPNMADSAYRSAPEVWGINLFSGGDPKTLSYPGYIENIAYLSPHMVRVHNKANLGNSSKVRHGWLDLKSRTWDGPKVRKVVEGLLELENTGRIMINIPNWPDWMDSDKDGFLDEDQIDGYAELVGRFAEIVWEHPAARERVMFEIPNERDNHYHANLVKKKQPHRVDELARAYLGAAKRIRELAPGAKVGGPSVANSYNMDFHEQFIALTAPELDFYSTHIYASGDPKESDSKILAKVDLPAYPLKRIREILNKNSPDRRIPISLNEYNIAWSWETRESRMTNALGAVWDAWFVMAAFRAGVDSAAAWNENDGIYGKFSQENEKRPSAHLYNVLNTEFTGPSALLKTEEPDLLSVLATEDGNRLLLAHRGLRDRKISLPEGKWQGWIIEKGLKAPREIEMQGEADLPGVSLVYLER